VSDSPEERLRRALRAAIPPVDAGGPPRDLWPMVRRRLEEQPAPVSRLDWALLAALVAWLVIFPESLVVLLYHL
jgi:hypothetical protein